MLVSAFKYFSLPGGLYILGMFFFIFLVVNLGAMSFQELLDGPSPNFHGW